MARSVRSGTRYVLTGDYGLCAAWAASAELDLSEWANVPAISGPPVRVSNCGRTLGRWPRGWLRSAGQRPAMSTDVRPQIPLKPRGRHMMPADLIAAPNDDTYASAPQLLSECPADLRAYGRLDADGALLLIAETRDTDADGVPLSTVSVHWNRFRGEAISCATGEIPADPAHVELAMRMHTSLVLSLCAAAALAIGAGGGLVGQLVALEDWGRA